MFRRFLLVVAFAITLTACGSGGVTISKKVINSDNGETIVEFTVRAFEAVVLFKGLVEDVSSLCESGTATPLPAAPVTGVPYIVTFTDCLDENGITYNGNITVTFSLFNSWTDMAFTLEFSSLTAAADWFGGTATFTGQLDYSVLGMDATISLLTGLLAGEVMTGDMGKLVLSSVVIGIEQSTSDPDIIRIDASSVRGEFTNTDFTNPLPIKAIVNPRFRVNTADPTLRCPTRGKIKVETTRDGSFALIEYLDSERNTYEIGTNGSRKKRACP
jgi:hypothetical protein